MSEKNITVNENVFSVCPWHTVNIIYSWSHFDRLNSPVMLCYNYTKCIKFYVRQFGNTVYKLSIIYFCLKRKRLEEGKKYDPIKIQ